MTVLGEAMGGGIGLSGRKRGWICDWYALGLRDGSIGKPRMEPVSEHGEVSGDCIGDSGNGVCSGASCSLNGPSSALAGEAGRLPGIGSNLLAFLCRHGLLAYSSTAEVSQLSKPSSSLTVSNDNRLAEYRLGESADMDERRMSRDLEVMGRRAWLSGCLKEEFGLAAYPESAGEFGSVHERWNFGGVGVKVLRWMESAFLAERAGDGLLARPWSTGVSLERRWGQSRYA